VIPVPDLSVVGSVNLDLVVTTSRLPSPGETVLGEAYAEHAGGKGLNQAIAAARAGVSTRFCGCVGDDDAGRRLRQVAAEAGLATEHIGTAPQVPTGRAIIAVSSLDGQNLILVAPGANSALSPHAAVRGSRGARVVLAQLEVPSATVMAAFAAARKRGATTVLNPAPPESVTEELLALCDFVIPNEHEARALGGAAVILAAGARHVVVTRGVQGSALSVLGRDDHAVEAFTVDAVDTTAAGDAYCGAFAAALTEGRDASCALRFASAAGALATTRTGAVPSLPLRWEIDELIGREATRLRGRLPADG
jgi:ribokinase